MGNSICSECVMINRVGIRDVKLRFFVECLSDYFRFIGIPSFCDEL